MKKILLATLAIASVVACSKEETLDVKSSGQIKFNGAFIDAATRAAADPSTTTGSIANFDVWGFMENATGVVFEDENVVKNGTEWTYVNTQYWTPGKTYYFAALSPMDSQNVTEEIASGNDAYYGLGNVTFTNVDGSEDLIYAATTVTTAADINEQPDPVKFQFNHLLSKVKFTFKNGFTNENTQLVVRNITMEVPSKGSINLAQADWWSTNEWELDANAQPLTLQFGDVARLIMGEGDECAQERLTIPANKEQFYKVTFVVDLYQGEVLAQTFEETTNVNGVALEIGKAYNFTAELNGTNLGLFPIEFEVVEVKDWVEDVDFQEEIVADAKTVTLVSDGKAEKTIKVLNNGILDGAGHTMSLDIANAANFMNGTVFQYINVVNGGTVRNLTIDGGDLTYGEKNSGIRGIYATSGDLVVENVNILNSRYAINFSGNGKIKVSNSTLYGWTSFASSEATFENVNFKNRTVESYNNFKPYGNVTLINCTFEKGFMIDMEELNGVITFVNCYYDGVLISPENYTDENFITYDDFDAAKVAFTTVEVTNAAQLIAALNASCKEVKLASNIDMTGVAYTPVGSADDYFSGVIDGLGNKIIGLTINTTGDAYAGLIAYADADVVIKNLTLENVDIKSEKHAAGLVCQAKDLVVENVTVSGSIEADGYAAGLVTFGDEGTVNISNCVNDADVKANRAGGITAWVINGAVLENVVNNGDITGAMSACGITNRIAGTIRNAKNYGTIIGNGQEASAGIAGTQTAASTFEYCFNYGNVTTITDNPNASAAGILGQVPSNKATLNYCANYGDIKAEKSYAAGIAYSLYGGINASYCYNAGNITGADGAGAIAPKAQYGTGDAAKYCLNAGVITSSGKVYQGSNNNTSCYYYSNDKLLNVVGNTDAVAADALAVLNGGTDTDFFTMVNNAIVVAE